MNASSPLLVFASEVPPATLHRRVKASELVQVARGIYVPATQDASRTVREHWASIAGYLYPGALVSGRSAPLGAPVEDILYLTHGSKPRQKQLPGLRIVLAPGASHTPGDIPLPGGLYLASRPRAILENARFTRTTATHGPWGLGRKEMENWLDRLCAGEGEPALQAWLDELPELAEELKTPRAELQRAQEMLRAVLGSHRKPPHSRALAARKAGHPYDQERARRFRTLVSALQKTGPRLRNAASGDPRWTTVPFFEAYFSNYIEGTAFPLDQAERIVYENEPVPQRPADAHYLAGTYAVVADRVEMSSRASSSAEFLEILKRRHAQVVRGRPEREPGIFKDQPNQAGNTLFVAPELVVGTLTEGFSGLAELDGAFQRAVYMMFVVSDVHPFADGNGRVARIMMNAELVAADQVRIIIPTVYRDDYLGALRRLSRNDDPDPLIKAMDFAQRVIAACDFSSLDSARRDLAAAHAFDEDTSGSRLIVPEPAYMRPEPPGSWPAAGGSRADSWPGPSF